MLGIIDTIGMPAKVGASAPGRRLIRVESWDVATRVLNCADGTFAVSIELRHVCGKGGCVSALPAVQGFSCAGEAAAYTIAWVDAWTAANR